jgi:hypothetical protein
MRFLTTAIAASALSLLSLGVSVAAPSNPAFGPVLDGCPIVDRSGCADAVAGFVASYQGDDLNKQLISLVAELAYQARHPILTADMCVELQAGMRVAADAATLAAARQHIRSIADDLCDRIGSFGGSGSDGNGGSGGGGGGNEIPPGTYAL